MTTTTSQQSSVSVITRLGIFFFLLLALFVSQPASPVHADTSCYNSQTVTSGADSGHGTLRQALVDACADGLIILSGDGANVTLASPLILTKNVTIGGDNPWGSATLIGNDTTRLIQVEPGVTATLQIMEIAHGKADHGGAILNLGTLILNQVTLDHNTATGAGGAIDNQGTLTLNLSTLGYNTAGGSGGGIANSGTLSLDNVTAARNGAASGGALANTGTLLKFKATLLSDSTAGGDCANSGTLPSGDVKDYHNLVEDGSCPAEFSGDPLLSDLASWGVRLPTFIPLPDSLAINSAGSGPCSFSTDERGFNRPDTAQSDLYLCDIGAAEEQGYVFDLQTISGGNQIIPVNTTAPQPLKVWVASSNNDATEGGMVTFTSPTSGPSTTQLVVPVKLAGVSSGVEPYSYAEFTPTANGIIGPYTVHVDFHGALPLYSPPNMETGIEFTLTNCTPHYTVTTPADSGPGSLRDGVLYTCPGGTIDFDPSLSGGTITLSSTLELIRDVTIDGSGLAARVTLSGNNAVRVLKVPAGVTALLRSLVITQGITSNDPFTTYSDYGGGINNAGTLSLEASLVTNNKAGSGAGIANLGEMTVTRSEISNNACFEQVGGKGGAMYMDGSSVGATIVQSTISGNFCQYGAGIASTVFKALTISGSTFANNGRLGENGTQMGGAIWGGFGLTVENSTFYNNRAVVYGVMYLSTNINTLRNNTFWNPGQDIRSSGSLTFTNNLVASGTCAISEVIPPSAVNLSMDASCPGALPAGADLHLGPLADNGGPTQNFALEAGSPAIDAGTTTDCPSTDQRGYLRDASCDIGSYEYGAVPPDKDITSFSFTSPAATGVITGTNIAVTVPFGTNVTSLVANFTTTTGASVKVGSTAQVSGTTANNFTNPVTYRVTTTDATTKDYTVVVTRAANPAKDITSFSFSSPTAIGVINGTNIAVTVPSGTNVTALVPTITHSGASINPNSGVAQNFTSPVTYTVTAADGTTKEYTVTVTRANYKLFLPLLLR
jgi:hypothetical protein